MHWTYHIYLDIDIGWLLAADLIALTTSFSIVIFLQATVSNTERRKALLSL
jgi:hypothetical protein